MGEVAEEMPAAEEELLELYTAPEFNDGHDSEGLTPVLHTSRSQ